MTDELDPHAESALAVSAAVDELLSMAQRAAANECDHARHGASTDVTRAAIERTVEFGVLFFSHCASVCVRTIANADAVDVLTVYTLGNEHANAVFDLYLGDLPMPQKMTAISDKAAHIHGEGVRPAMQFLLTLVFAAGMTLHFAWSKREREEPAVTDETPPRRERAAPAPKDPFANLRDPETNTIRVNEGKCSTCLFNPDRMTAARTVIQDARDRESFVECHETYPHSGVNYQFRPASGVERAMCGGYWNAYRATQYGLVLTESAGWVRRVPVPPPDRDQRKYEYRGEGSATYEMARIDDPVDDAPHGQES